MSIVDEYIKEFAEGDQYRDKISTVDQAGKRVWIYPKMPKGNFYNYRKIVSYVLLLFLFGMPFIQWNGRPLMLFNILETEFIIFGVYFAPQDFYLFGIVMIIGIVFISLFTVIYGRLFCGWVCPQTIFMEMVFRRIEYWIEGDANAQKRLDKSEWTPNKVWKKCFKHFLFILISLTIAHTFLSYIIGVDSVYKIVTDPIGQHLGGFIAMVIFTAMFYGVFSILREQVCTTICPYGRLQGVLLDEDSLAVSYDFERGEPRGKMSKPRKGKKSDCKDGCSSCKTAGSPCPADALKIQLDEINQKSLPKGDCIDCSLCVQVCPTGIDIRNGVQLECINCTACMDACDEVMTKIKRPTGLIRIDSYNGIVKKKSSIWNARVAAYSLVLVALVGLESFLFVSRSEVETLLLRTPGMMYQTTEDGYISNLYNYQLINKSSKEVEIKFSVENKDFILFEPVGKPPRTIKNEVTEGAVFIKIPREKVTDRSTKLNVSVYGDGELLDETKTTFLGPTK